MWLASPSSNNSNNVMNVNGNNSRVNNNNYNNNNAFCPLDSLKLLWIYNNISNYYCEKL